MQRIQAAIMAGAILSFPLHAQTSVAPSMAVAPAPILTADMLQRLARATEAHGVDGPIDQDATHALGITNGQEQIRLRQLVINTTDGKRRIFDHLPSGEYIIAVVADGVGRVYRLDSRFSLITAVICRSGEAPVAIPIAEAQTGARFEVQIWIRISAHV